MGKRTLASCWKQYEKLSLAYLDGQKDSSKILEKLEVLTDKTNVDKIGNALFTLFVSPYVNICNTVEFTTSMDGDIPNWQTKFDPETGIIQVHPLSIFRLIKEISHLSIPKVIEDDFIRCRHLSFLTEISKLTSTYVLFLLVLQRVAYLLEIAHLEKRGGVVEVAEDEAYHTLLWAFKELENFLRKTYGLNIRAHYGISWYEAEWITGR